MVDRKWHYGFCWEQPDEVLLGMSEDDERQYFRTNGNREPSEYSDVSEKQRTELTEDGPVTIGGTPGKALVVTLPLSLGDLGSFTWEHETKWTCWDGARLHESLDHVSRINLRCDAGIFYGTVEDTIDNEMTSLEVWSAPSEQVHRYV